MPITIQEIIASDTISQLVDKTNFNFDQLLLNGGGPSGPIGPKGPTGPAGGRGPKGSTWYTGTVDPTTITVAPILLDGDYYLQDSNSIPPLASDGDVWEYIVSGVTGAWSVTTVNLSGPTGPQGAAGGFGDSFGQSNIAWENTLYNGQIGTITTGANASNEGVPSILIGGVASNYNPAIVPNLLTDAYIIPDAIAIALASDVASTLIHQKDSGSKALIFHGGGDGLAPDYYEQSTISMLSSISIGVDDRLVLAVPKAVVSSVSSQNDLIGFSVDSEFRSQSYLAGQQIRFVTGDDTVNYGASENSNFEISVGTGGSASSNKFHVETLSIGDQTSMEMGGTITLLTTQTTNPGALQFLNGDTRFINTTSGSGTGEFRVNSQGSIVLDTTIAGVVAAPIDLITNAGVISATTVTGNITEETTTGAITENTTTGAITSTTTSGNITSNTDTGNIDSITIAGSINLLANDPGAGGGITIESGDVGGAQGFVKISSRISDIVLDSKDTGNIELLTNSKRRAYFDGGTGANPTTYWGQIAIGGSNGNPNSSTVPYQQPLIVIDSIETFSSVAPPILPTTSIQLGIRPRARVLTPTPNNVVDYNGGGEIMGTYLPLTTNPSVAGLARFNKENEGALHLRGGIVEAIDPVSSLPKTVNPGSIWIYNEEPNGRNSPADGQYLAGSVRLWSTPRADVPSTVGLNVGIGDGITLGLNADLMAVQTNGTAANTNPKSTGYSPVTGRVSLYGISDNAASLSGGWNQNTSIAVSANSELSNGAGYAGVNVGDKYRATQTFKVWGDYMGDQFVGGPGVAAGTGQAAGGGIISGVPGSGWNIEAINQQSILSGSTNKPEATGTVINSFSPWIRQQGGNLQNAAQNETEFAFRYQWTRVGRVVTGSGTIKQRVVGGGAGVSPTTGIESHDAIWYSSGSNADEFKNYVDIGPIPFPVQAGTGNSTYEPTIDYADGYGVNNYSISGTAQGVIDYTTRSGPNTGVDLYQSNGAAITTNFDLPGPPATGILGVGGASAGDTAVPGISFNALAADTLSMGSDCMWIRMWPSNQAALGVPVNSNGGVIPAWIKFTFSYELNNRVN
jgi:hypothetical protein